MFALAIWDAMRSELIIARDPYGIKPLYYATLGEDSTSTVPGFIFASEVRALLASGLIPKQLSAAGLSSYLEAGSVQTPLTIVQGVRSLMPGTYLRIKVAATELKLEEAPYLPSIDSKSASENGRRSHALPSAVDDAPPSREIAVQLLRKKLRDSVEAHLVSDVPLGVFLSGGMDSSALVALMSEVCSEPPKTFSVVFDEKNFSEALHSQLIARRFSTDHQEVHLSEQLLLEMLPEGIASLDQPTMDGINTYVVSKAVKDAGITVALSGLGGDELFAGYATFRRALRMQAVSGLAKRVLRSASGIGSAALNGSVQRRKFWQLAASDASPLAVYSVTRQLFTHEEGERIANCELRIADCEFEMRNPKSEIDIVNTVSLLELTGYMANTLLRDTDCTSMAHSLEVRVPFVDTEIVPFVLSLPGKWKLNRQNGKRPKPLLADAMGDLLPAEFLQRPKMGFTLPFERWMQSRLKNEISDVFSNEVMLDRAGLRAGEVAYVWGRFLKSSPSVGWSRPWALFVLAKWCELNGVES